MERRIPLCALAFAFVIVLLAGCDVGPKFHFDFGKKCELDCPCQKDSDCSSPVCRRGVCSLGTCTTTPEPDGVSTDNRRGDCAQITCSNGRPTYSLDPTDVPSKRECLAFHCEPGKSSSEPPRVVADPESEGESCS